MTYNSFVYTKIIDPIFDIISEVNWDTLRKKITGRKFNLSYEDWTYIARLLKDDYYVILNFRKSHLSTYAVILGSFLRNIFKARLEWSHWSHAFCNLEKDLFASNFWEYRFMEAVGTGVRQANFYQVFNCDGVALIRVRGYLQSEVRDAFESLLEYNGRIYDNLHSLATDQAIDCVELVKLGIQKLPNWETKLSHFKKMIEKPGSRLVPQDYMDCPDFEAVYVIRR